MKAMQLSKPAPIESEPLKLVDLGMPEPGEGQVRVKVSVCGVCHTDLHTVEGDLKLPKLPIVPGHEIVGRIDKVGEGVSRERLSERVGVPWLYETCGECSFCREGRENLCPNARFTGYHENGGYAEYMVVPEDSAYPIPDGIADAEAAPLMCGGVIGYRALVLSKAKPGQILGLYGFGNSAHVTIQVALYLGIRVFVFSRTPANRKLAEKLGAEWTGGAEEQPPERIHSGIIFAPAGPLVPMALRHLRSGGTIAMAGITMTPIPAFPYELIYSERGLRSVANSTHEDVRQLLDYAGKIPVKTEVTEFPLEDANKVLRAMKESKIQGGAILKP
ncbi:zinc-dependent alcohol dehydrogenase family protein [candidate division WOR-3 bacterium]|nr:zinc-dependent alcohol dehydrogenase family protein [candidate division WOR-3 bacterium]